MERAEGDVVADDLLHFFGNDGVAEGAAQQHAVADDHDFGAVVDHAAEFGVQEHFGNLVHAGGMVVVVAGVHELFFFAVFVEALMGEEAVGGADAFHEALAEAAFGFLFENLVLEGRGAAVDNKDFLNHYLSPFSA